MVSAGQFLPDVLKFFQHVGRKGGKRGGPIGGKRSPETMTSEERTARAKQAAAASAKVRKPKGE